MRRLPTIIGAGLVAAATASAIAVTGGSAQAPGGRTLTFVEREVPKNFFPIDVRPLESKERPRPSTGDGFVFEDAVLDATGATKLGTLQSRCTFVRVVSKRIENWRAICDGVYVLRDGTINHSVALDFTGPTRPVVLAVTGGTGAYEGARGSGINKKRSARGRLSDTTIHLLP